MNTVGSVQQSSPSLPTVPKQLQRAANGTTNWDASNTRRQARKLQLGSRANRERASAPFCCSAHTTRIGAEERLTFIINQLSRRKLEYNAHYFPGHSVMHPASRTGGDRYECDITWPCSMHHVPGRASLTSKARCWQFRANGRQRPTGSARSEWKKKQESKVNGQL